MFREGVRVVVLLFAYFRFLSLCLPRIRADQHQTAPLPPLIAYFCISRSTRSFFSGITFVSATAGVAWLASIVYYVFIFLLLGLCNVVCFYDRLHGDRSEANSVLPD